ncbi:MAG TPA: NAD(P)H-dependent glycerol-3-phosphate dehydrogenase [Phycisphaerae bacterium]|nr:NAD(P)H-dependent glycerol-3-phosphate dehydrogenase [Phycisphaerae bacterium]
MPLKITTIGDGAMATVCSQILAGKHSASAPVEVVIWGRDAARLKEWDTARENKRYLPGIKLAPYLKFDGDPATAFANASYILCAVPTQYIRTTLTALKPHISPDIPVISVSKGIEISTLRRPSEIIIEVLGSHEVCAASGPNIAGEMARKLPATMVVAAESCEGPGAPHMADEPLAKQVQEMMTTPALRVYRNADLLGVELAGALKNVIAIAAGILDGMAAGHNAKAALLTRGLVEITRLGVTLGAQAETFAGLAGLGDLVTTCFSPEGRNRKFGERIGRGEKAQDVLDTIVGVVEGMPTCKSVVALAKSAQIEMPICEGLYAVLFEGRDPRSQLADLMSRELKREIAG